MDIPQEVQNYFNQGEKKIVSVEPLDNYKIVVTFNDGIRKIKDFNEIIQKGFFKILQDKEKFSEVFVDKRGNLAWDIDKNVDSNVVWNNRIDLCKDSLYIYSEDYNGNI